MTTVTMTIISSKLRTRSSSSLQRGGQEREPGGRKEDGREGEGRYTGPEAGTEGSWGTGPLRRVRREGWAPEEEWR